MPPSELPGLLNERPRFRRTTMACLRCRERKCKCSGEHPICQQCALRGITCEYSERSPQGRNSNRHSSKERRSSQTFLLPSRPSSLDSASQRTATHGHHIAILENKRRSLASQDISLEMSPFYDPSFSLSQPAPPPTADEMTSIPYINETNDLQPDFENIFYLPTVPLSIPHAEFSNPPISTSRNSQVFSWPPSDDPSIFPPIRQTGSPIEEFLLFQPLNHAPSI